MAYQRMQIVLALFVVTMIWVGAMAQFSSDCTQVLISMSPCLNYTQGNSPTPSSACCAQLASVVSSEPQCLCQALNGGSSLGISIDRTRALALPQACKVQTPPTSQCNAAAAAAGSPTTSPAQGSSTPSSSAVPSGRGSSTVSSTGSSSSDAISTKLAAPLLFFFLFVASYVSISTMSL